MSKHSSTVASSSCWRSRRRPPGSRSSWAPSTYGIFDVFPDDGGRDAHLNGKVAAALMENAGELYGEPALEKLDVLASKLPGQ